MAMVCPQCNGAYEQRLQCPQCGVRLLFQVTASDRGRSSRDGWRGTPWGRLVIGLSLAQGLYAVLKHLISAGFLVSHDHAPEAYWSTFQGLVVLQVLEGVGVFAACLLTGAGQRRGYFYGAFVGVWSALLFLFIRSWTHQPAAAISMTAESILLLSVGALGGLAGGVIWKPLPAPASRFDPRSPTPLPPTRTTRGPSGPLAWGRVIVGVALAVGGVVWANVLRELVVEASEGKLRIETHLQAELVAWEISAFAMLIGSALAGATKTNGLKQGLAVGIGTAAVLLGIRLSNPHLTVPLLLVPLLSALCLGVIGGWFGSQLLPPVYTPRRKKNGTAFESL